MEKKRRTRPPGAATRWHKTWVQKHRAALLEQLGGKCALCGSTEDLTFDHIKGRDYVLSSMNQASRIRTYKKEAEQGLLRVLCWDCNRKHLPPKPQTEEPF